MNEAHTELAATLQRLHAIGAGDMTMRQLTILLTLNASTAPWGTKALSEHLGYASKAVITRAVTRLAILHFVDNDGDPKDGRKRHITITPRGREFLAKVAGIESKPAANGASAELAA